MNTLISDLLYIKRIIITVPSFTNGYTSSTYNAYLSSYKAIAIAGFDTLTTFVAIPQIYIDTDTEILHYTLRRFYLETFSGQATADSRIAVYVLYMKIK